MIEFEDDDAVPAGDPPKFIRPTLGTLLWRAVCLRCPRCGEGKMYRSMFSMHSRCSHCEFRFERGGGYYLGSVYINYGLTAMIMTVIVIASFILARITPDKLVVPLVIFILVFPTSLFRHSRAFWLVLDCQIDRSVLEEG